MLDGFQKIIEERIRKAQLKGEFKDLPGSGKPLSLSEDAFVPEDLRLAYKILKNADCIPPEIELKKEINQLEALMADMKDEASKYRIMKKINVLIMKVNLSRQAPVNLEIPQQYEAKLVDRFEKDGTSPKKDQMS